MVGTSPTMTNPSLLRQLDVGGILAGRVLGDGLAADHALLFRGVGQRRLAVELPALVELGRHAMAEAGVVGPGQVAIEPHGACPSRPWRWHRRWRRCAAPSRRASAPPCDRPP